MIKGEYFAFIFLFIFSFFNEPFAQWTLQTTNVDRPFAKIFFINSNRGWALVNSGYMFSSNGYLTITENGGASWTNLIHSAEAYPDITFINDLTGWMIGNVWLDYGIPHRYIRRTTNGGYNWQLQNSDSGFYKSLYSVFAIDNLHVWVTGSAERILKTTNGGVSWLQVQDSVSASHNYKIIFINSNTGFITGTHRKIYKTTNSGINWLSKYSGSKILYDMNFVNSVTGWCAGDSGILLKTTNAGENWQSYNTNFGNWPIHTVFFLDEFTGYIGGGSEIFGGFGLLTKTINGGYNWIIQDQSVHNCYNSIYFINSYTGWVAGGYTDMNFGIGKIYKTTNGGVSGIIKMNENVPNNFSLHQNYPNPFNPATKIKFEIPLSRGVDGEAGRGVLVKLVIYDIVGREVATLINEELKPCMYEVEWDGSAYASGVYFYSLITSDFTQTKKLILLK